MQIREPGGPVQSTSRQESGAAGDTVRKGETRVVVILLFALAVAMCLVAPLLFTWPEALDAAASPAPAVQDGARAPSAQATSDGVDSLNEKELATWRLRSSD